jgi:hypothetical protein
MITFDVRYTPTAPIPRLPFVGHLRFVLCNVGACTMHAVNMVWTVAADGTKAARGARVEVTHNLRNPRPENPHGSAWVALVPASVYPGDDTCLIYDLASLALGEPTFSTRNRDALTRYAACPSDDSVVFRAPPGDYFVLAGAAGASWWTNPAIRRKVTVGASDVFVHLTDGDRNHDNCGD